MVDEMFALITKLFLEPRETSSLLKRHNIFWTKYDNSDPSVSLRFAKKSSNRLGEKKAYYSFVRVVRLEKTKKNVQSCFCVKIIVIFNN